MIRDYFFLNVDIRPRHGCTDVGSPNVVLTTVRRVLSARIPRRLALAHMSVAQAKRVRCISEVTPAYARVVGLSRFLKLGECVTFTAGEHRQLAEVVQIDEHGLSLRCFAHPSPSRLEGSRYQRSWIAHRRGGSARVGCSCF
jgi:hypothetical protein